MSEALTPLYIKHEVTGHYRVLTLSELFSEEIPPREKILSPWLTTASINMVHAHRGTGKSFFCMNIALCAALGQPFLEWACTRPYRVLYIDGEMDRATMQQRFRLLASERQSLSLYENLRIFSNGFQREEMPDLATKQGQEALAPYLGDAELIIVDNLSSLARGDGNENDAESWLPVQNWLVRLRAEGRCILYVHHSGKSNAQRGTSKREDAADTVLNLRAAQRLSGLGTSFSVVFEKARDFCGSAARPIKLTLQPGGDGKLEWTSSSPFQESNFEKVTRLRDEGMSQSEIVKVVGVNKSTVSRYFRHGKESKVR